MRRTGQEFGPNGTKRNERNHGMEIRVSREANLSVGPHLLQPVALLDTPSRAGKRFLSYGLALVDESNTEAGRRGILFTGNVGTLVYP